MFDKDVKEELKNICLEEDLDTEFDNIIGPDSDEPRVLTPEQFEQEHEAIKRWVLKCQDLRK